MILRELNPLKTNSYFLFGARGTGKSTFVREQFLQAADTVLELNLLDPHIEDLYARNPNRLEDEVEARLKTGRLDWVFIDEVQKVPRLLDLVHKLIEQKKIKFILTGSSSRKLKRGAANLLAGRAFVYPLFPFSFIELKEEFHLDEALHWGTLPRITQLKEEEEKSEFLRAYALTYLKEEVQMEQLVRNLDPFRHFLEVAAQSNGQILNFSSIAKDVGHVDHKTVQSYFQILEDTHLGFLLPAYHCSVRKSQSSHPKFYFFDTGVKRALDQTLDVPLKPATSGYGDAFEHVVILECFRLNQYKRKDYRFAYFCDRNTEIDLILTKAKKTILIEIKSARVVDPSKVKNLSRIAGEFGPCAQYWLSQDPSPQRIGEVQCLYWQEGLKEIFEWDRAQLVAR